MALYAYIRVSTEAQSYDRQIYQFNEYFSRIGIDKSNVTFIQEKITSYTSFKERAIYPILVNAQQGDIIYICQLDRLGRTVEDIIQLVKFADERGIILQAVKESMQVTYKTQTGKMMLTLLAMVAEMERDLRAERCKAGIEAAKDEIKRNGARVSRCSGRVQTRMGNEKGCDMSAANEASCISKQNAAILWREQSVGYQWVKKQLAKGKRRDMIIEEFNELHETDPLNFSTSKGKPLTKGTLSHWASELSPNTQTFSMA